MDDIAQWDTNYQEILNQDRPDESEFGSERVALAHLRGGRHLATLLRAEVPSQVAVTHHVNLSDRLIRL